MHKNIEEILLNNIKLPQYRKTWRRTCCFLNHLLGLHSLTHKEKEAMQIYWHMLFIRVSGEKHISKIKYHQRYALATASKIITSKESCNDN